MLFLVGEFIFVLLSEILFLSFLKQKFLIQERLLTKIGTALFLYVFLVFLINIESVTFRYVTVFAPIVMLFVVLQWFHLVRELQIEKYLPTLLQNLVMEMQLGLNFQTAFEKILELENSNKIRNELRFFYENVIFTQHKNHEYRSFLLNKVGIELKNVADSDFLALERTQNLLKWIKNRSEFRRRSGKVLSQIRLQSVFILGIYLALLVFMERIFGFEKLNFFLPYSFGLMFMGFLAVFAFGRRIKWRL